MLRMKKLLVVMIHSMAYNSTVFSNVIAALMLRMNLLIDVFLRDIIGIFRYEISQTISGYQ